MPHRSGTIITYRILVILVYLLLAGYTFTMWVMDTRPDKNLNSYGPAKFVNMVYGRAEKPFVTRALVPLTIRGIRRLIPDPINYYYHGVIYKRYPSLYGAMVYLGWEVEYLTEYAIALVLMFGCLMSFLFGLRALFNALYEAPFWFADLIPFIALLVLPVFFVEGTHYIYDMATLMLFTWAFYCMAANRRFAYYVVFILSTVNRETTYLLILVYALYYLKRQHNLQYLASLGLQALVYVLIRGTLAFIYRHNPGSVVIVNFGWNMRNLLLRPYNTATVVGYAVLATVIIYRWKDKHLLLRRATAMLAPMYVSYMVVGVWHEIRVFYEFLPILLLLTIPTFAWLLNWPVTTRPLLNNHSSLSVTVE